MTKIEAAYYRHGAEEHDTPEEHGASDCEDRISEILTRHTDTGYGDVGRAIAALDGVEDADSGLINAVGWRGVYELAGLEYDAEADVPSDEATAWCARYSAGWRAAWRAAAREWEAQDTGDADTEVQ